MGKVIFNMTMSLDGFVAGENDRSDNPLGDGGGPLFNWYNAGDVEYSFPGMGLKAKISKASANHLDKLIKEAGALITGRKTFDIANAWGGQHPVDLPVLVLTHHVPQEWANRKNSPFIFVTDGIESAVRQAQAIAGDKYVEVGTASTLQQALAAGLMDEIHVDIVPVVMGKGVKLFDNLKQMPQLEQMDVVIGTGVTHMAFRVVK